MKKLKERLNAKLSKNGGFTLIEMLIVVAIIAILVAVSIPMVSTSLNKAKKATDDANIRAAKAAATVEYYNNDGSLSNTYYDAVTGTMVNTAPKTGYNQQVVGDTNIAAKDAVIQAELSGDVISVKWVAKGN